MKDVVIIGAGASGLMAALFAARAGARALVIERNGKAGRKLYITGKGRCNVTNDCSVEEAVASYPQGGRFLYSALNFFPPSELMELLESLGVPLKVERGRRVFPASDKASDVTRALVRACEREGVSFLYDARVRGLMISGGMVRGVRCGAEYPADAVIVATGGLAYPATGSTGDGYALAQSAGHSIAATKPSLVPLETREGWCAGLAGITLKNVELSAFMGGKRVFKERGELLFTHFGVSGPLVLSASSHIADAPKSAVLKIDLKPAVDAEALEKRVIADIELGSRRQLIGALEGLLPQRLLRSVLEVAGLNPDLRAGTCTKSQRAALIAVLKGLELNVARARPYEESIITRGGVDVKQIDPKTMRSKLMDGLLFSGEVLDVDGYTGGFNLQAAFSTGALAGHNAAIG